MREGVAAYFDLDGTLLDASSEKTLAVVLGKKRPWRIPYGVTAWCVGFLANILRFRAPYDAARNRGHFSLTSWEVLEKLSKEIAEEKQRGRFQRCRRVNESFCF